MNVKWKQFSNLKIENNQVEIKLKGISLSRDYQNINILKDLLRLLYGSNIR